MPQSAGFPGASVPGVAFVTVVGEQVALVGREGKALGAGVPEQGVSEVFPGDSHTCTAVGRPDQNSTDPPTPSPWRPSIPTVVFCGESGQQASVGPRVWEWPREREQGR